METVLGPAMQCKARLWEPCYRNTITPANEAPAKTMTKRMARGAAGGAALYALSAAHDRRGGKKFA